MIVPIVQSSDRRQVGEIGFYYVGCLCRECEELRAKDNANASPAESKNDAPREMWREDLGAIAPQSTWASTLMMLFIARQRDLWKEHETPSASYAFWLGQRGYF